MTTPRLRPLTCADVPELNRLLAEIEKVDRTGEHYNEAELAEDMANPDIDPEKDMVGAYLDDELVGYFGVIPRPGAVDLHKVAMYGGVRPDLRDRGIGTVLAATMRRRAEEAHVERYHGIPALLTVRGLSDNVAQEQLMADIGLVPTRWSFVMRADLSREPERPRPLAAGLEVRRYDESLSDAMLAAHNAAFADHPNFAPWTESMWRQWVTGSRTFRPHLTFAVVEPSRPDEVAAYVQTAEFEAYLEQTGKREAYVAKVGTRREYRGRGLASALLRHALHEYRLAGYDEASLDVDSENPTGALGIYRRAGFEVESRWTDYSATIAPSGTRPGEG